MPQDTLFGKTHAQIIDSLSSSWWAQGPPVCFLEGFPGVGKSNAIVPRLRGRVHAAKGKSIMVAVPEPGSSQVDDLLLDLAQELAYQGSPDLAAAIDRGANQAALTTEFEKALRSALLVVWDEAQHALDQESGEPLPWFRNVLSRIAVEASGQGAYCFSPTGCREGAIGLTRTGS